MSTIIDNANLRSTLLLQRGDEGYGVASTVTSFAEVLKQQNCPLTIVCVTEGRLCERLRSAGLEVDVLDVTPPPRVVSGNLIQRALLLLQAKSAQRKITERIIGKYQGRSIDAVQTMNYLLLDTCGQVSQYFDATGVWRMPSGVQSARLKKLKQFMMSRICDKYGLVSMATSNFTKQSIGRNSPLSVIVHHGCDARRFCPDTVISHTRDRFGIADDDVVFGIFAQIPPNGEKGQLLAVQALVAYLEDVREDSKRVHLILCGGPTDNAFVAGMVALADSSQLLTLHIAGAVSEVERYYGLLDVSLSTRLSPEPFGLSVIESMMMGVPVLAHALGGPAETVIDGQTGWLVHDTSVEAWASAFSRVIGDSSQWPAFSKRARLHALNNFTIDAEVKAWSTVLNKVAPSTT